MTTCVLLPLLRDRHCQQPLLCHRDAKDCRLWHRQAGELRGQAKGCRQAPTGELGLEGGFFTWAGLIPAACSLGWTSVSGEFKLGYSHCHSLNITFIF